MPKIRDHCYLRYCQRVLNMTEPDSEIKQYIIQHREKLTREITNFFNQSKHLWSGQLGDKTTRNFYVKDNYYIVCSKDNENMITVIKIDFGFPEKITLQTINSFVEAVEEINQRVEMSRNKAKEIVSEKEAELNILNNEIELKQRGLNCLKGKKNTLEAEINVAYNESLTLGLEAEKYIVKLFYSKDYTSDISIL